MNQKEWESLQDGDLILYEYSPSDYTNTICKVIKDKDNKIRLEIITPGIGNVRVWVDGRIVSSCWTFGQAYKFSRVSLPLSKEERIINKIKTIDKQWMKQQAEKGTKYHEMFRL